MNETKYVELFSHTIKEIDDDIKISVTKLNQCNELEKPYYQRAYIRSYAAWIEGSIWIYKELLKNSDLNWHKGLPLESQLYIFEYDLSFKNNGMPKLQQKKIKTKINLKAFFIVMNQLFNDFSVDTGEHEWELINNFYIIRNRITHPTSIGSFNINKDELIDCEKGRKWLEVIFTNLRQSVIKRMDQQKL